MGVVADRLTASQCQCFVSYEFPRLIKDFCASIGRYDMTILFLSFLLSVVVGAVVIRFNHLHSHVSGDHAGSGPQKFHAHPTPRIGGVPIMVGMLTGLASAVWINRWATGEWVGAWLIVVLPAFAGGIAEDLTKKVGALHRLLLSFVAAGLGFWLLDARLIRLDLGVVDTWLAGSLALSLVLTMIAAGGVAHALNIIDGFNGLAGMVTVLILGALGFVCFKVGDMALLAVCASLLGATVGFLLWNYPRGLIFAGDGGAYLWGFVIAEISILLVARHPEVSAWFPLMLVIYPVWETLFTIYRRKVVRGTSPGMPDGLHFHSLIYRRLIRWMVGSMEARQIVQRNSMTAPYLWGVCLFSVVPAVLWWSSTTYLMVSVVVFMVLYVWIYQRIVRFRTPKMLVRRRRAPKLRGLD